MSFSELSAEVAKEFIHSAVLIDDQINWSTDYVENSGTENSEEEPTPSLVEPEQSDEFDLDSEDDTDDAEPIDPKVDANKVIKAFSEKGIVCSPFIWESDHCTKFPHSSDKADLLILDWNLGGSETKGTSALKFIKDRLENDLTGKQRLRFISIYSSEKKDDILTTIFSELSQLSGVSVCEVDDGLDITLESGHKACRISHISKHVPEEDLADHLISGFAEFAGGFLPNILLSAISEIRNHTYEYLALFNKDLDTALLSHFMALHTQKGTFPTAEMQFREYSTNLVSDHLKARLHFSPKLGAIASKETITKYLGPVDKVDLQIA
ncbi:response regulator receiver domain [Terasakiella sp. A23]|uniref:response regulator receiver domain n=1 Tax=Terasakiella sp. FCG-A23 TaxID=3080561 RepID=UPI00295477D7|nr:response regulator receiver domain [Terasakiella sp. A23]MDV7341832.1 response regulator receiver domain [Terasakiella sp. A23]